MAECFRPGDVVRAEVLSLGDARSYYLSTAEPELGVVRARCVHSGAGVVGVGVLCGCVWRVRVALPPLMPGLVAGCGAAGSPPADTKHNQPCTNQTTKPKRASDGADQLAGV